MGTIFRVREEENRGTEKIERLDSAAFVIVDFVKERDPYSEERVIRYNEGKGPVQLYHDCDG